MGVQEEGREGDEGVEEGDVVRVKEGWDLVWVRFGSMAGIRSEGMWKG